MTNLYTIEQLKIYLNNETVKDYCWIHFNLTPDAVLDQIQKNIDKRNYFNDYYNKRKQVDGARDRIKENNKNWYDRNKIRVAALQRCRYATDPEYKKRCQQYQALYAQNKRNVNRNERNVGRPRTYNFDSN
jgi:exonuclease VII large subunit